MRAAAGQGRGEANLDEPVGPGADYVDAGTVNMPGMNPCLTLDGRDRPDDLKTGKTGNHRDLKVLAFIETDHQTRRAAERAIPKAFHQHSGLTDWFTMAP